ncbi:SPOR domain-containing protein [Legionella yabuuchiae]|uniref:SPOR domain-containing protein n=1 Tax=Legionella yabuuchiae TaxID=376727 RepID=UPI001F5E5F39|nr:SPOR domain-containing protein [Legionella yabuuchiae]
MRSKIRVVTVISAVLILNACTSYNPHGYMNYQTYTWGGEPLYPESYDASYTSRDYEQEKKPVVVPETYHVGAYHSPARAKDRDRNWVQSQSPSNYTIELAEGDKASKVAGTLVKAPKTDRRAQIRYEQNGTTRYKGLYGSYPTYEAAKQALNTLPDDVRAGAKIESWGSVQRVTE